MMWQSGGVGGGGAGGGRAGGASAWLKLMGVVRSDRRRGGGSRDTGGQSGGQSGGQDGTSAGGQHQMLMMQQHSASLASPHERMEM